MYISLQTHWFFLSFPPKPPPSLTWSNSQLQLGHLGILQLKAGTKHLAPTTHIHTTSRHWNLWTLEKVGMHWGAMGITHRKIAGIFLFCFFFWGWGCWEWTKKHGTKIHWFLGCLGDSSWGFSKIQDEFGPTLTSDDQGAGLSPPGLGSKQQEFPALFNEGVGKSAPRKK